MHQIEEEVIPKNVDKLNITRTQRLIFSQTSFKIF